MEIRGEYCLRKMKTAVQRHRSSGYPGNVLYFRSHSSLARAMGLSGWWYDPFMGFRELCDGNFDYHVVGSTHSSMIEVPEIGTLMTRSMEKNRKE